MNIKEDMRLLTEFLDSLLAAEYISKNQLNMLKGKSKMLITNLEDEYKSLYTPKLRSHLTEKISTIKKGIPPSREQSSNPDPVDDLPF